MSAQELPVNNLEKQADQYISDALRGHERGSFILFKYEGRVYAGISEPVNIGLVAIKGEIDKILVRVTKIDQPPHPKILPYLSGRCRNLIFEAKNDLRVSKEFYARLDNGSLVNLVAEEWKQIPAEFSD